ncbi:hypothetical protein LQZ21_05690 [Treponema sp. TIM-1]|uniref:hypothetical protein n=1 Tax=Treponema sp. TIM-1 TaxID=2898417 RepID=UPI00398005D9
MEESQPPPGESREKSAAGIEKAEQELVFYYSRTRRLERASPAVRELNDPTPVRRPSLFGTLTATKPLTFLFMSVVILVIGIFITSYFSSRNDRSTLGGNSLTLSAMRFEGSSYIVIKKTVPGKTEAYTGIVDIAVSVYVKSGEAPPGELPLANRRVFFSPEPEEEYRITVPFEAQELLFLMRAGEEYLNLRIKTE